VISQPNPNAAGKKADAGKQRWYAMPLSLLTDLSDAFNFGEGEYGLFNCLQPFEDPRARFWNATMRHLEACQVDPLAKDSRSGCYHAACAAFNILMYLYHSKREVKREVKVDPDKLLLDPGCLERLPAFQPHFNPSPAVPNSPALAWCQNLDTPCRSSPDSVD
jgi:hypothetical protein